MQKKQNKKNPKQLLKAKAWVKNIPTPHTGTLDSY